MTLDEYRIKICRNIETSRSNEQALAYIQEARNVLYESNISQYNRRQFWTELYTDLTRLNERQSASALSAIIAAAQQAIAQQIQKEKSN